MHAPTLTASLGQALGLAYRPPAEASGPAELLLGAAFALVCLAFVGSFVRAAGRSLRDAGRLAAERRGKGQPFAPAATE